MSAILNFRVDMEFKHLYGGAPRNIEHMDFSTYDIIMKQVKALEAALEWHVVGSIQTPEGTCRSAALSIERQVANMMLTLACENVQTTRAKGTAPLSSEMPEMRNAAVPLQRTRRNTS